MILISTQKSTAEQLNNLMSSKGLMILKKTDKNAEYWDHPLMFLQPLECRRNQYDVAEDCVELLESLLDHNRPAWSIINSDNHSASSSDGSSPNQ